MPNEHVAALLNTGRRDFQLGGNLDIESLLSFMANIGFTGGSSLCELGPISDVMAFFKCLEIYISPESPETDFSLLTDRLYRRYLKLEELDRAKGLMGQARDGFGKVMSSGFDWEELGVDSTNTRLRLDGRTLSDVFAKYFESFEYCLESARLNYEAFKAEPNYNYEPVRTVLSDLPWFMMEKRRPLDEYEALDGRPFWQASQRRTI